MNRTERLQQIMNAQADLMDAITETLVGAQRALVESNGEALEQCTRREEDLLRPFHELERERLLCVEQLAGASVPVHDLLPGIPVEDRVALKALSERMKTSASKIMEINLQNSALLRNALRFVQETLRAATDDNRRKLIDERV
jgi:flagellar biosynthesis/type III secretory pathway chaperone